jgi:hypothetical protein
VSLSLVCRTVLTEQLLRIIPYRLPTGLRILPAQLESTLPCSLGWKFDLIHWILSLEPVRRVLTCLETTLMTSFYFEKKFEETGGKLKPEARLPMSMLAAFMFPVCPLPTWSRKRLTTRFVSSGSHGLQTGLIGSVPLSLRRSSVLELLGCSCLS